MAQTRSSRQLEAERALRVHAPRRDDSARGVPATTRRHLGKERRSMRKRNPRKQTSARVSTLAARIEARIKRQEARIRKAKLWPPPENWDMVFEVRHIRPMCLSLIGQDETRGQKLPKSRKAKRGRR